MQKKGTQNRVQISSQRNVTSAFMLRIIKSNKINKGDKKSPANE